MESLLRFIGDNLGLKKGDIVFTGTPSGVGLLKNRDHLSLRWGKEEIGCCTIG